MSLVLIMYHKYLFLIRRVAYIVKGFHFNIKIDINFNITMKDNFVYILCFIGQIVREITGYPAWVMSQGHSPEMQKKES